MRDVLSLVGAVLVGVGVGLHYLPAGVAVFGAVLYLDALLVTLLERRKRE